MDDLSKLLLLECFPTEDFSDQARDWYHLPLPPLVWKHPKLYHRMPQIHCFLTAQNYCESGSLGFLFCDLCFFCLMTYCEYAIGWFTKMHGLMFRCSSVGTHNPLQNSLPWDKLATDSLTLWPPFSLTELPTRGNFKFHVDISLLGHDVQMFAEYMLDFTWFYLILVLEKAGFLRENNVTLTLNNNKAPSRTDVCFLPVPDKNGAQRTTELHW